MSYYTAPVEDMSFVLKEVVEIEKLCNEIGLDASTVDIIDTVLDAAGKLAKEEIEPINKTGDSEGLKIDSSGKITTATGFKEAYQHFVEGGWGSLQFSPNYGGQGVPFVVAASIQEMWHSANMSWGLCPLLTQGAVEAITLNANEELKQRYLPKLISGEWSGTMNLTEGDAGTDVGSLKTRATPNGDHYLICGQKIYITWGEHDMSENIIHLVLARLPNSPQGVKGISLFLVPKILVNDDGSLGESNDLKALSIEHKIGIHACPTCVMSYGEEDGAIGYLVGEENRGIQCMFTMMNNARLTVGLQGVSVSERAYQQALSFCNERVQGIAPGFQEPGPIARHPDVQRMLANMKSITEASRALAYSACAEVDYSGSDLPGELLEKHKRKLGILTPVVKGWCTETAQEVASVSLQCHGGMGYVEETGIAQILRDARILPIYEGTNGIQAMDLIGRKIISDDGLGVRELILEMQECVEAPSLSKLISMSQIDRFKKSLDDLEETVSIITKNSDDKEFTGKIAFDTLMMIGTISAAWQMLLSVERASSAFKNNTSSSEFLKEKTETAKHYLDFIMPRYLSNFSTISACTN
ncbi:acyl-CoA dehydrogenase family protein [Candidatus Thioglobus sp.]|nr:acyl-CoA dehydrogenase family protein [Candidatus Thioglobus sp.]MDC1289824.1 acyl-CoA dehydrogenase family protein [Candidatus Thioglobus sp.]